MNFLNKDKKSKAVSIAVPKEATTIPMTVVDYDCPHCGERFSSPMIGMPIEKIIGQTLNMTCITCSKRFLVEVGYDTPKKTL